MAAKTVTIDSQDVVFPTLKEAQHYYRKVVEELYHTNLTLSAGQDFEDLKWIYTTYCGYTDSKLASLKITNITGFKGIMAVIQNSGRFVPTECCAVLFADGTQAEFTTDKAIKEIASKQNPR